LAGNAISILKIMKLLAFNSYPSVKETIHRPGTES
jgi:hypothetical protein